MTTYTGRTIPSTTYTGRSPVSSFLSYTWDNAPDTWAGVTANWDNYGTTTMGTIFTGRTIPA